jgi:hypothetical protein
MAGLSWAMWLAAPVVVTLLAALFLWWRGRPERPVRTAQTISGHRAYLEALAPAAPIAHISAVAHVDVAAEGTQDSPG